MNKITINLIMDDKGDVKTEILMNGKFNELEMAFMGYNCDHIKHHIFDRLAEQDMKMALAFFSGTIIKE